MGWEEVWDGKGTAKSVAHNLGLNSVFEGNLLIQ